MLLMSRIAVEEGSPQKVYEALFVSTRCKTWKDKARIDNIVAKTKINKEFSKLLLFKGSHQNEENLKLQA